MSASDRRKHMRIVSEIMLVHLPSLVDDQQLTRDLLSVLGVTVRAAFEDAQRSATAWDKKAYHVKADRLRDEWGWAPGAANYAEGLAYRDKRVSRDNRRKLRMLIKPELSASSRRIIKSLESFRGAAAGNSARRRRERSRTPKRSLV